MRMTTYINFPGNCAEAFRYYEEHLGAVRGMMMTHADAPATAAGALPPEWQKAVLHATVTIAGSEISGADIPNAQPMRSVYLTLHVDSDAEAERVYAALADGGTVLMKMEQTFFASRFGQVRDRFGINWMILTQARQ